MKKYQFLSHTADVRLKIEANNLEELFSIALEAMGNLIKKDSCSIELKQKTFSESIEISSIDVTSLLIDFLSEVLAYIQVNKIIYCHIKFEKLTNNFLKAKIFGDKKVDKFDEDIKGVTYHEAEIIKNKNNNFETIIIFDI